MLIVEKIVVLDQIQLNYRLQRSSLLWVCVGYV